MLLLFEKLTNTVKKEVLFGVFVSSFLLLIFKLVEDKKTSNWAQNVVSIFKILRLRLLSNYYYILIKTINLIYKNKNYLMVKPSIGRKEFN